VRAALALALLLAAPAFAQEGRRVFDNHCASCHAVDRAAPPGAGPNLAGVMGRPVGSAEGFDYSPVLEAARAAGDRWDPARMTRFLEDPEEMYPGLWMGGNGVRNAAEREAVAAFLQSAR
jgi:cytochrome c